MLVQRTLDVDEGAAQIFVSAPSSQHSAPRWTWRTPPRSSCPGFGGSPVGGYKGYVWYLLCDKLIMWWIYYVINSTWRTPPLSSCQGFGGSPVGGYKKYMGYLLCDKLIMWYIYHVMNLLCDKFTSLNMANTSTVFLSRLRRIACRGIQGIHGISTMW